MHVFVSRQRLGGSGFDLRRRICLKQIVALCNGMLVYSQAVAWGLPKLAEMLLLDLMKGPHNKSFEELANGGLGLAD